MNHEVRTEIGHRLVPHSSDMIVEAWAPTRSGCLEDTGKVLPMNLHDFIQMPAVICSPKETLVGVARLMEANDVGSVVVIDSGAHIVGIVTDRDLAIRALAHRRTPDTRVDKIMTPNVTFLREDADVFTAATQMATSGCRRMPVVDAEGHTKGVVSLDDLLTLFVRQTDKLAEIATAEMPRRVSW
jgi:signal-transduction protein with cAMP-binding, CBS, and nucleotidyltransferase domain